MRSFSQTDLRPQIAAWVGVGLITDEQGSGILARYPAAAPRRWPAAFLILGGLLCLGGIILVIASNWQEIAPPVKMGGLLALLAGSYALGIETQRAGRPRAWWEIGYLGAAVFPLLGMMLVSQIFHVGGSAAALCLVWTLAVAPLPLLTRSVSSFVVLLAAIVSTLVSAADAKWWLWMGSPEWRDEFRLQCVTLIAFGAACGLLSQLWLRLGERVQRNVGEFIGLFAAFLSLYVLGCEESGAWAGIWLAVFLAALGLIARGYRHERVHQVNLGFCLVGLVLLSTFFRLVGTMLQTGAIFIVGGLAIIACVSALEWVRRRLLTGMKK